MNMRPEKSGMEEIYEDALRQLREVQDGGAFPIDLDTLIPESVDELSRSLKETEIRLHTPPGTDHRTVRIGHFCSKALDILGRFAGVIDVLVQANPCIAGLIWGGLKFFIIIAKDWEELFEKILDTLDEILSSLPRIDAYSTKFLKSKAGLFRESITSYYRDIIAFGIEAFKLYRCSTKQQLFSGKSRTELSALMKKVVKRGKQVEDAAKAEHMLWAQEAHEVGRREISDFRQELTRKMTDLNLAQGALNPRIPPPGVLKTFGIPNHSSPHFRGREPLLEKVARLFEESPGVAIHGMPGVGKTQFAMKYAIENRDSYDHIFWISGSSLQYVRAGLLQILDQVQHDDRFRPAEEHIKLDIVKRWLESEPTRWLLVIDNVEGTQVRGIRNLLPRLDLANGHILCTGRDRQAMTHLLALRSNSCCIELPVLGLDDCVELFVERAGIDPGDSKAREGAENIVCSFGFLPLAVEGAAALVSTFEGGLGGFLEALSQCKHAVLQQDIFMDYEQCSIARTFDISFRELDLKPDAKDLFSLFAFLDPGRLSTDFLRTISPNDNDSQSQIRAPPEKDRQSEYSASIKLKSSRTNFFTDMRTRIGAKVGGISERSFSCCSLCFRFPWRKSLKSRNLAQSSTSSLASKTTRLSEIIGSRFRLGEALKHLDSLALIRRDDKGRTIVIHDLVHDLYRQYLRSAGELKQWAAIASSLIGKAWPDDTYQATSWKTCQDLLPHLTQCAHLCEEVGESELVSVLGFASSFLSRNRQIKESIPLAKLALSMSTARFGEESREAMKIVQSLAYAYRVLGQPLTALPLYEKAAKQGDILYGRDSYESKDGWGRVGRCLIDLPEERWERAGEYMLEELTYCVKFFGRHHKNTADAYLALALLYHQQKSYPAAETLLKGLLSISKDDPRNIPDLVPLLCKHRLGRVIRDANNGRMEESESLLRQALENMEEFGGPKSVDMARMRADLAYTIFKADDGRTNTALVMLKESFSTILELLGDDWQGEEGRETFTFLREVLGQSPANTKEAELLDRFRARSPGGIPFSEVIEALKC